MRGMLGSSVVGYAEITLDRVRGKFKKDGFIQMIDYLLGKCDFRREVLDLQQTYAYIEKGF